MALVKKIIKRMLVHPRKTALGVPSIIVDSNFGTSRGTPIDRLLIENFLRLNSEQLSEDTTVLEFSEGSYSEKFYNDCKKFIFIYKSNTDLTQTGQREISGDLLRNVQIDLPKFDVIIATQLLAFTQNPFMASASLVNLLKPGGKILGTEPFLSPLSVYDNDRWGDFYRFTSKGLEQIYKSTGVNLDIRVEPLGNWETSYALIKGLVQEDNLAFSQLKCSSHATGFGYVVTKQA